MRWQPLFPKHLEKKFERDLREYVAGLLANSSRYKLNSSLENGLAAWALFFSVLDRYKPHPQWRLIVQSSLDALSTQVKGRHHGLFAGTAGTLFIHRQLSSEKDLAAWKKQTPFGASVLLKETNVDLVNGLAGVGIGLLGSARTQTLQSLILERLNSLSSDTESEQRVWSSKDDVDLGIAHGVPGVVLYLSYLHQVHPKLFRVAHRRMAEGAVEFLLNWDRVHGSFAFHASAPQVPTRAAWCYGDPGVGLAIFRAGQSFRRQNWKRDGLRIAKRGLGKTPEQACVVDSHFCHGSIGLAHLSARLHQSSGDETFSRFAKRWYSQASHKAPRLEDFPTAPDIVSGSMGYYLYAMAGFMNRAPSWDRFTLISGGKNS